MEEVGKCAKSSTVLCKMGILHCATIDGGESLNNHRSSGGSNLPKDLKFSNFIHQKTQIKRFLESSSHHVGLDVRLIALSNFAARYLSNHR